MLLLVPRAIPQVHQQERVHHVRHPRQAVLFERSRRIQFADAQLFARDRAGQGDRLPVLLDQGAGDAGHGRHRLRVLHQRPDHRAVEFRGGAGDHHHDRHVFDCERLLQRVFDGGGHVVFVFPYVQ